MTRILLVEDQINLAHFIALELNAEGYQVSVKHDIRTGLIAAQVWYPDMIVVSWDLPRESRMSLHYQLRADGNQVPMIGMTVEPKRDRVFSQEQDIISWLTKPFSMNDLLNAIQQICRKSVLKTP
ncbi:response regulator transcription factor [Cyanobacteria bacterium FACHB-63]|nr:response regulator transcription factor [Cyanobacteria bacterium FACHB-63]